MRVLKTVLSGRLCAAFLMLASLVAAFAQDSGSASAAGSAGVLIAAAGDIACDPLDPNFGGAGNDCHEGATSDQILNAQPDAVLPLGDNQYYCGGYRAYQQSYDNTWGRFKSISRPVVGNHEYLTVGGSIFGGTDCDANNANAKGHYDYWNGIGNVSGQAGDRDKGYYSYDEGNWHLVALNSQCTASGGCGPTSPQAKWLTADLAAHKDQCTLAYWHIPVFSSGGRAAQNGRTFWDILQASGAEVVLSGHDHMYERFAPQSGDGTPDPARGIRQFVVGTGGEGHTSVQALMPNSEINSADTFGVLFMTLGATGYTWNFSPEAGRTFSDSGSGTCHPSTPGPDTTPPSAPRDLTATAQGSKQIDLSWSGSGEDTPAGYAVYREGTAIANLGPSTRTFSDTGLSPGTRYHYTIDAFDESGNRSSKSNAVVARTFSIATLQFTPVADAYVDAGRPTTNFGSAANLQTTSSPEVTSYLRFDLSGLESITSAKLRVLPSTNTASQGFAVRGVSDSSWGESSITHATRPALGAAGGTSGQLKKKGNTWEEIDVSSLVTQGGAQSLALTGLDSRLVDYGSRESGANAPTLIVTGETRTPPIQTLNFGAAADTYVDASRAGLNFGTASTLKTGASPELVSYARFNLANVGTAIKSARLRVVPRADNATGFQVRGVGSTSWGETATTYANRPAVGPVVASSGALKRNTVKEVDVTSLVTQDGGLSLALTSTNAGSVDYASREAGSSGPQLVVTSEVPPADTQSPSIPLLTDAAAAGPKRVNLAWSASTDNVAVGGYTIYRDGAQIAIVGAGSLSHRDSDVVPDHQYTYAVDALDTEGNRSQKSNALSATTPPLANFPFTPVADTYVSAGTPGSTFGASTVLRTNSAPEMVTYLRFDVSGLGRTVLGAKLRIFSNSGSGIGYEVRGVPDSSWSEAATTYDTRPAVSAVAGSSGPTTAGAWTEVDVTSLVAGNGQLSLALTSTGSNASYASREAGANAPQLIVEAETPAADPTPPTVPTLTGTTAVNSRRVDLTWAAATDNVGVTAYAIRRNGSQIATAGAGTIAYSDTTVEPGGTYSYTVEALDAAGNRSGESNALSVTTPSVTNASFTAAADTFVDASNPSATFGVSMQLRTDASPVVMSYLRFNLAGLGANVVRAKLRIFASSGNGVGYDVRAVSDSLWGETTTSYDSRPATGAVAGSSGPAAAGTWTEVDVTSLVTGDGPLSLAITSTSATNATYASRETGANAPQLLVETY